MPLGLIPHLINTVCSDEPLKNSKLYIKMLLLKVFPFFCLNIRSMLARPVGCYCVL